MSNIISLFIGTTFSEESDLLKKRYKKYNGLDVPLGQKHQTTVKEKGSFVKKLR
jgi:hypothetical protein